jgi:hypothetical protein
LHGRLAFLILPSGDEVKTKKPTAVWQWVDKFRERIKTRLPRWSAARSQAAGLNCNSRL